MADWEEKIKNIRAKATVRIRSKIKFMLFNLKEFIYFIFGIK